MLLILQTSSMVTVANPRYTVRKLLIPLEGEGEGYIPSKVYSTVDSRLHDRWFRFAAKRTHRSGPYNAPADEAKTQ
jgi:hypothetical protein